ncbi:response regulator [Telmatospirillum siberiense]|uniref:Response regulatory domain-containing protein n=1 Tax=Telmatospirillum siberiense TaxID=382514 RepID=A0A2N3PP75_9PROT|nr:response regulator [Telmatospirillum siberiense]PKU22200.1 hypothetical protein CWS72_22870 [Telmatospirillum siberiense]
MSAQKTILAGRRLLVADDESFSRFFVVRMARDLGCEDIIQAVDGADALSQIKVLGDSLSALILDFNMPEINGLRLLKMIRSGEAKVSRNTNVLMLTGNSDFALVGAAMALDVDAFLIKPVSEAALTDRLSKIFSEARDVRPAAEYAAVDIDKAGKLLLSNKPVTTTSAKSGVLLQKTNQSSPAATSAATAVPGTVKMRLDQVAAGSILAENIRGPTGELLLGVGTVLSGRLLNRLAELQSAIKLDYVVVREKR